MKKVLLAFGMAIPFIATQAQVNSGELKSKAAKISTNLVDKNDLLSDEASNGDVSRASLFTSNFSDTTLWAKGSAAGSTGSWAFGAAPAAVGGVIGVPTGSTAPYAFYNAIKYHPSQTGGAPNPTQNSWIATAHAIDLTSLTSSSIRVDFKQMYRPFNTDKVFVEIANATTPTTWVSTEVNTTVATNVNAATAQQVNFSVTGMDSVYIRFRFTAEPGAATAGGYGWSLDDINVYETPSFDVKLVDAFAGLYTKYPLGQEDREIPLSIGAKNDGGVAQAIGLQVKSGATTIGTATATVNPGIIDTIPFTTFFTPTLGIGVKPLRYSATYNDVNATDTIVTVTKSVEVTPTTFSKDRNQFYLGMDYAAYTVGGLPITNVLSGFQLTEAANATSVTIVFGDNTVAASTIKVVLNKVVDGELEEIAVSDLVDLAANQINTASSATPKEVKVDFFNTAIALEPGEYWVSVDNEGGTIGIAFDPFVFGEDFADQGGASLLFSTDNNATLFSLLSPNVPYIRLNLNEAGVSIKENELAKVSVYPNPTSDVLNIAFGEVTGDVVIKMFSTDGKLVSSTNMNVVNGQTSSLNVNNLSAGIYSIQVSSNKGVSTQKVVIR